MTDHRQNDNQRSAELEREVARLKEENQQLKRIQGLWERSVSQLKEARKRQILLQVSLEKSSKQLEERVREVAIAKAHLERTSSNDRTIIEHMSEGVIVTDATGAIQFVNPAFTRITGYMAEEALGKNPSMLSSGRLCPEFYDAMWKKIGEQGRWQGEVWNRRKNGDVYPEQLSISAVNDWNGDTVSYIGVFQDITARKHAETRLVESEKRLKQSVAEQTTIFNNTSVGVALITDHKFKKVNDKFKEMFGYSENELIAQPDSLIYTSHDKHEAFYSRAQPTASSNTAYSEELAMRRCDGNTIYCLLSVSYVNNSIDANTLVCVVEDITQRREHEEKIKRMATYDNLTNLPNRSLFMDRATVLLSMARRNGSRAAILFVDLDGFKPVNDTYGHGIGDKVLSNVASRLTSSLRQSDTVARFGGDEFVILLPDVNKNDAISAVAKTIVTTLSEPFVFGAVQVSIGASVGIAIFPEDADSVEALIGAADNAMYDVKESGKSNYSFVSRTNNKTTA